MTSGSYGGDGAEYRTEIDSFSRIVSRGSAGNGPAWFEVRTKSGQIMEFGHSTDSQVLAQGKTTARSWLANKVLDTKGNYFILTYTNDPTNGQAYPNEINYSGNAAANLTPFNKVQFVYATRPDVTPTYQGGSLMRTNVVLTNVKAFAGSTLVSDYRLSYDQSGSLPVSRLSGVTLCSADGCLPPTSFGTSGAADGSFGAIGLPLPNGWNFGVPARAYWMPIVGDFNGDGKTDVALLRNNTVHTLMSNGDFSFNGLSYAIPNGLDFGETASSSWMPIVGDFNGDGKTDFALLADSRLYTFLSTGDGSFLSGLFAMPTGMNFGMPAANSWMPIIGDFNGDSKTDFALLANSGLISFLSVGDGGFLVGVFNMPGGMNFGAPATNSWIPIIGDFNGDGKTDFAMLVADVVLRFMSNGDGSVAVGSQLPGGNFGSPVLASWMPIVGDFNGDGKTDYALLAGNTLYTFFSAGDGNFMSGLFTMPAGMNFGYLQRIAGCRLWGISTAMAKRTLLCSWPIRYSGF